MAARPVFPVERANLFSWLLQRGLIAAVSRPSAWFVSLTAHAGVLGALAVGWTTTRLPGPSLAGQQSVASLQAALSIQSPDWRVAELSPSELPIVAQLERVQAVERPEPVLNEVELPSVEVALAPHTEPAPPEPAALPEATFGQHPASPESQAAAPQPVPSADEQSAPAQPPSATPQQGAEAQATAPAASMPSVASAPSVQSVGFEATAPRPLSNPPPLYPEAARRARQQGTVILRLTVAVDGAVKTIEVADSSGFELLDEAATSAVRNWRFAPAVAEGRPVPWVGKLPVRFSLSGSS
ncbi:MAG: energy transducer TonB [Pirellulales bacterium]|nr:energy transducer TonB [Pirellulales bacterium]